jgi:hypothetical protein
MAVSIRWWDKTGNAVLSSPTITEQISGKETDRSGTAQAGSSTTITLDAGASSEDDHYNGLFISITSGTGSGQAAQQITDYVGSTRVATVGGTFSPTPNGTSVFRVHGAQKIFVENTSDRSLGSVLAKIAQDGASDGHTRVRIGLDTATVMPPFGVTVTILSGSGTWGSPTTIYYRITGTNAAGETTGSVEVVASVTATQRVQLDWTNSSSPASTGIKVYRTTVQGDYTGSKLRATLGQVTQYIDTGGAVGAGALPTANTTGGPSPTYGVPPALATSDLTIGTLPIGQQRAFWLNIVPPAGAAESGNPRTALIRHVES